VTGLFDFAPDKRVEPQTETDWKDLEYAAMHAFTPHKPIDESSLFAGRSHLIDRVIDVVFQEGQHCVLFGQRGVGKSSLANIIQERIFGKANFHTVIKRNCTTAHDYKLIWQHVFADYNKDGKPAADWIESNHNPFDIYQLITALSGGKRLIIIIDEFDRISDPTTKVMMSDTVKYLSDYGSTATLIIVGVARDVTTLFSGHESIGRNIDQVLMPNMETAELREILHTRLKLLNMDISGGAESAMVRLSQGLPGYIHLMGQASTTHAIKRRSLSVDLQDLNHAIHSAIEKSIETVQSAYAKAVRSPKPGNQYRQALLACALAEADIRGAFTAAAVREPFSMIMKRDKDIPSFARHLNELCRKERGPALIKEGHQRNYEYSFADPLLKPYTVIRSIGDGLITHDDLRG
jgi:Cdc6-like AAA superfamily ATPase